MVITKCFVEIYLIQSLVHLLDLLCEVFDDVMSLQLEGRGCQIVFDAESLRANMNLLGTLEALEASLPTLFCYLCHDQFFDIISCTEFGVAATDVVLLSPLLEMDLLMEIVSE